MVQFVKSFPLLGTVEGTPSSNLIYITSTVVSPSGPYGEIPLTIDGGGGGDVIIDKSQGPSIISFYQNDLSYSGSNNTIATILANQDLQTVDFLDKSNIKGHAPHISGFGGALTVDLLGDHSTVNLNLRGVEESSTLQKSIHITLGKDSYDINHEVIVNLAGSNDSYNLLNNTKGDCYSQQQGQWVNITFSVSSSISDINGVQYQVWFHQGDHNFDSKVCHNTLHEGSLVLINQPPTLPTVPVGTLINEEDYSTSFILPHPAGTIFSSITEASFNPMTGADFASPTTYTFSASDLAAPHTLVSLTLLGAYTGAEGKMLASPDGQALDYPFLLNGTLNYETLQIPYEKITGAYTTSAGVQYSTITVNNVPDDSIATTITNPNTHNNMPTVGDPVNLLLTFYQDGLTNLNHPISPTEMVQNGMTLSDGTLVPHAPQGFNILIPHYVPDALFTYNIVMSPIPGVHYNVVYTVEFGGSTTDPLTQLYGNGHGGPGVYIGGLDPHGVSIFDPGGTSLENAANVGGFGEGGKNTYIGLTGTNDFIVNDSTIASVQGALHGTQAGAPTVENTLFWNNPNNMDMISMIHQGSTFSNIDKIDLGENSTIGGIKDAAHGVGKALDISYSDVLAIAPTTGPHANTLFITGNEGHDKVQLDSPTGTALPSEWKASGNTLYAGFSDYVGTGAHGVVHLEVHHGISVL